MIRRKQFTPKTSCTNTRCALRSSAVTRCGNGVGPRPDDCLNVRRRRSPRPVSHGLDQTWGRGQTGCIVLLISPFDLSRWRSATDKIRQLTRFAQLVRRSRRSAATPPSSGCTPSNMIINLNQTIVESAVPGRPSLWAAARRRIARTCSSV